MKQVSIVNTLAAQIRAINPGTTRSDSMRQAWGIVKSTQCEKITFTKLSGEMTTRIISRNWSEFYMPVGGQSNIKPGQVIFADMAKVATGKHPLISTYKHLIAA